MRERLLSIHKSLETWFYKNFIVPMQGKHTFNFVSDEYSVGSSVLDFGCGVGTSSIFFDSEDYIGVDIDLSRVQMANRLHHAHSFIQVPAGTDLPFNSNSFDIVFISLCMHHIQPENWPFIFKEIKRVLKNNGKVIGIEPAVLNHLATSTIFMNVIDAGDYILPETEYMNAYENNGYSVTTLKLSEWAGYRYWAYSARIQDVSQEAPVVSHSTRYRRNLKPIHIALIYGKWFIPFIILFVIYRFFEL